MKKSGRWRDWGIPVSVVSVGLLIAGVVGWTHRPTLAVSNPVANAPSASTKNVSVNSPVDPGTPLHGRPAPAVSLTDQFGKPISLSQFHGKVVVLAFVDSECTTICPLTTQSMVDAVKMLGPQAAQHVQLVGINANPAAITVADVKNYSIDHAMLNSWHFLTGSLQDLKSVWHNYYIYTQIVQGQIDHTPALYIIDPQGKEQVLYLTPSQYGAVSAQADVLAHDIARYLPKSVKVNVPAESYTPPKITPAVTTALPQLTSSGAQGTVTVGPGHPQLLVYFASWVNGMGQNLEQISKYAQGSTHPHVVAIDVAPTEPSLKLAANAVAKIPHLSFPVAVDKSGDVADAYNVQDLAWMTLTDGKGHIIWSHDGWVAEPQLSRDIAAALQKAHVAAR